MEDVSLKPIRYILTSVTDLATDLTTTNLALTSNVTGITPSSVTALNATAAVTGVNAVYTTAGEGTPVIGATYYLVINVELPNTQYSPVPYRFQVQATTTSFTDLVTLFVAAINANPGNPFTASGTTHLVITEAPQSPYGAGGVVVTFGPNNGIVGDSAITLGAFGVTTAHVAPIGQYWQLAILWNQPFGTPNEQLFGTPSSGKVYSVVNLTYNIAESAFSYARPQAVTLYFENTTISAANILYIISVINHMSAVLGLSAGDSVQLVPTATTAAGNGIIPKGIKTGVVTSASANNFVSFAAGWPVGTSFMLQNTATGYKIAVPATESINNGTVGSGKSSAVAVSQNVTLTKMTTTEWFAMGFLADGTAVAAIPASA